jgi:hypothetical protein
VNIDVETGNSMGFARCGVNQGIPRDLVFKSSTAVACGAKANWEKSIQATLYAVVACLTCLSVMMAMRANESARFKRNQGSKIYWLDILTYFTVPLKGFLNMLIFIRHKYLR